MVEGKHKALVISDFWATILGTALTAILVGGMSYAFTAYGQQMKIQEQQQVLQDKITGIEGTKMPERMAVIEMTVRNTQSSVESMNARQEAFQNEMRQKMDRLVQQGTNRGEDNNGRSSSNAR